MRKTYLFALLAMILVVAFAGMAVAAPLTQAEQKELDRQSKVRPTFQLMGFGPTQSTNLDEQSLIYGTTFETADGWTIVDGGEAGDHAAWELVSSGDNTYNFAANAPFMWVDSDTYGDDVHMIETLISPELDAGDYTQVFVVVDVLFENYASDSLQVLFTTDNGTTWTEIETYLDDFEEYDSVYDISDIAVGESSFQIAFHYDDADGCQWYAGVDNFRVYGIDNDDPLDILPPEIDLVGEPSGVFVGDDVTIVATATDNVALSTVELVYGVVVNLEVPTLITATMNPTGNEDEFSAVIPGDVATAGDTIAYYVIATDMGGNFETDPDDPNNDPEWYKVYPPEANYSFNEVEYSFTDISETGSEISISDSYSDFLDLTTLADFSSFEWYGTEYEEITVSPNGWIAFGHETSTSSFTPDYSQTLPSSTTPNLIVAGLADDYDVDEEGSGKNYWEIVDGKLVIQYGTPEVGAWQYLKDFGPTFQIVLDRDNKTIQFNYHTVELTEDGSPYIGSHQIGFENENGQLGGSLYAGTDWTFPVNGSSYLISGPLGTIDGTVTASSDSSPIEGVTVTALDGETIVASTTTDADGDYSLVLLEGSFDVNFAKTGYVSRVEEDVVVVLNASTPLSVTLDEETTTGTLSGVIYSADTDNPIEGILVELVEAELSMTTGADGAYSFADVAIGDYTIDINAEFGLTTYHNLSADVTITETMDPVDYSVSMIMAPENLQPTVGNMTVTLTFDPPANHATPEMVQGRIDELELIVSLHDQNLKIAENIDELREQLAMYRTIYANLTTTSSSLDEIADFVGYRVKQDDDILEDVFTSETIELTNLLNNQQYSFQVAADYGYGDDLLLFCDAVNATPDAGDDYWFNTTIDYSWVEIRTNNLGTRVPYEEIGGIYDDEYSGMIEFADGMPYYFFGTAYTEFNIGSNGFISFTEQAAAGGSCPYSNTVIPTATAPNGYIAPHWDWTEISNDDAYSAYYYYDSENSQVIVTWYLPEWNTSDPENILEYQVILDLSNFNATFNYKSHTTSWPTSVTIGIENQDGTDGIQYDGIGEDEMAIMVVSPPIEIGSVVGSVVDSDENGIGNVEVWADDMAIATTGADGSFGPVNLLAGTYDFTFVHDDYWTETTDDVEITAGNETTVPEVTMVYPEASVSPSSFDMTYNITTGGAVSETFDLENNGTGPMEYSARVELVSTLNGNTTDQPREHVVVSNPGTSVKQSERDCGPIQSGAMLDELWDLLYSIDDVSTEFENDYGFGAALHGDYIYVSECLVGEFATYEIDGTFVSTQDIPAVMNSTTSTWTGLNDLASDPDGFLYGTNDDGDIFKFTPDFATVIEWGQVTDASFDGITIAFDYDNQYAYVSNFGSSFTRVDADGNTTSLTDCPGSAYGMAYVPGDPDGYTIYAHVDNDTEGIIVRYNPSTDAWESTYIFETFDFTESGLSGGLDAGLSNDGRLDLIALDQDSPDMVKVFEGYPYALQQWLTVSPAEGTIQAAGSQQMTVTINADNDPEFAYEDGDIVYASIIVSGPHMEDVSVVVTINFVVNSAAEVDGLPTMYALHQNYPNPFNPSTEIKFDLVQAQNVKLVVFNTLGQEVARLMDAPMQAGYHVVTFDASTYASGVYFYRIETEAFTSMKKMVMVK